MAKAKRHIAHEVPITFQSQGHQLVGMHHQIQGDKILIMCHGFTGSKIENKRLFVEAARAFAADGISVLRFDFFGSGDSEGEFEETLVSHNIANLKDAMAWAREQGFKKLAVLGISMGAATAILTLEHESADALLLWSAVPDFEQLFASYTQNPAAIVEQQSVIEHDGWLIGREFFIDAMGYNVPEALARIEIPKFIVQGSEDAQVFIQGFQTFQDIATPPAYFMEIPGAGHTYQTPKHRRQVIRQTAIWLYRHF